MSSPGKTLRLSKIIDPDDERAVVVAADHGFMLGPIRGVIDLEKTLRRVVDGQPDAVLLSPGQAAQLNRLFRRKDSPALLVRADWTNAFRDKTYTLPARKIKRVTVANARDAIAMGASGIVTYFFLGQSDEEAEARDFELMSFFARECRELGLPLIVEALPMGERVTGANFADLDAAGMRIAAETGADALKVLYTGDIDSFERAVRAAGIPVLVLGGAKAKTLRDSLEVAEEALDAGAVGVVYGRQVVQAEDPGEFVRAVRAVVHEGKSAAQVAGGIAKGPVRLRVFAGNCTNCRLCEAICTFSHDGFFSPSRARLRVDVVSVDRFIPYPCTLCGHCVKSCPVGALIFNPDLGYVELIEEKCNGCKECVSACPFRIVGFDEEKGKPFICDMCRGSPKCAEWCQPDALKAVPYIRGRA